MAESHYRYMFNVLRNCQTVPKVVVLFHNPISSYESYSSSTCLPTFGIVNLWNFSHSNRCWSIHCGFNLHFHYWLMMSLFMYLPSVYFFGVKCLFKSFAYLKKLLCFHLVEFWEFFLYFGYKPFTGWFDVQNTFSFLFSFLLWSFGYLELCCSVFKYLGMTYPEIFFEFQT